MPTEIKLWEVIEEKPVPIERTKLDFEERLENWLAEDISIISNDLLIIGKQVTTAHGGTLDLLAIDSEANLVILELKRHKTPRDIVAQVLDYASWVEELGVAEVENIAEFYLEGENLESAFRKKFQDDLPQSINQHHRMYIVASELDGSTERIVKYLSEKYGADINVATFQFFQKDGQEFVGKSFLLDEDETTSGDTYRSKRRRNLTWAELDGIAEEHAVADLYNLAFNSFRDLFNGAVRTRSSVSFVGVMGEGGDRGRYNILNVVPGAADKNLGLLGVQIYLGRLSEYIGIEEEKIADLLGERDPRIVWFDEPIYGLDESKLKRFIELLKSKV